MGMGPFTVVVAFDIAADDPLAARDVVLGKIVPKIHEADAYNVRVITVGDTSV